MEFLLKTFIDIFLSTLGFVTLIFGIQEKNKFIKMLLIVGGVFLVRMTPQILSWLN